MVSKATIKTYFETGDKPTQAQFEEFIDSTVFEDEAPVFSVTGATVDNTDPQNPVVNVPTLQEVTTEGSITVNSVTANGFVSDNASERTSIASNGQIDVIPSLATPLLSTTILFGAPTAHNTYTIPDKGGSDTFAMLSDITGGGAAWGSITGTLSDQTDLQSALDAKQDTLTASNSHTFVDSLTAMTTPVDADRILIVDNSASLSKKLTWANIKATLKTYFDSLYQAALGYTAANVANNLSDLANSTTARANLKILQADIASTVTTTSSTASAITGLSFTAVANKTYFVEGSMKIGCSGSGGVKISVTIPSGATIGLGIIGTGTSQTTTSNSNIDAGATLSIGICTVNSSNGVLHFKGTIDISSTGGTVQFNFASGTNTQTSSIFKLGTYLIAIEK